jgi:hypothetical protein
MSLLEAVVGDSTIVLGHPPVKGRRNPVVVAVNCFHHIPAESYEKDDIEYVYSRFQTMQYMAPELRHQQWELLKAILQNLDENMPEHTLEKVVDIFADRVKCVEPKWPEQSQVVTASVTLNENGDLHWILQENF